jgi:hypothetical protein
MKLGKLQAINSSQKCFFIAFFVFLLLFFCFLKYILIWQLQLEGDVLVQSEETSVVDPVLLAVPLPIISLDGNKKTPSKLLQKLSSRSGKITKTSDVSLGESFSSDYHIIFSAILLLHLYIKVSVKMNTR